MGFPLVSVVIPYWNSPAILDTAVAALTSAFEKSDFEILVIDNGSLPDRRPGPAIRSRCRVVTNSINLGFARAANIGAHRATGRYAFFLNTDAVVGPGGGDRLVAALQADPRLGAVGAASLRGNGRREFTTYRFLNPLNHALGMLGWPGLPIFGRVVREPQKTEAGEFGTVNVDWIPGFALLVERRTFLAVGGFDEHYFFYEEDEDLCWRLRRRGLGVAVARDVVVDHSGGASTGCAGNWPELAMHESQSRFIRRRFGGTGELLYRLSMSAALIAKGLLGRADSLSSRPSDLLASLWKVGESRGSRTSRSRSTMARR